MTRGVSGRCQMFEMCMCMLLPLGQVLNLSNIADEGFRLVVHDEV